MGKKKQQLQPQPQPGAAAAAAAPFSLLLKGKPLWEPPSPHQQQRHEHMEGAETGSSSSGSGSSSSGGGSSSNGTAAGSSPAFSLHDGGNGRRPRHGPVSGAAASSRLGGEGEEGDAEITPESSPGSSNGDDAASSPLPPPLAPVGPTGAEAEAQAQQGALSPPPASPTPSLSLSELAGPLGSSSSSSSRRAAHEAALWSLLGAVKRGDGDGAVVDAGLLDRLLALGRLAFDPAACASGGGHGGSASPPRAGAAGVSLGWYARLLEAVAESELGAPPCALHRARIGAVFQCAAFFCRLKASSGAGGGSGGRHSPLPKGQQPQQQRARQPSVSPRGGAGGAGSSGGGGIDDSAAAPLASSALADLPPVCRGELRRRLATLLASLQCPRALAREEVDAMRRDDLLVALRWLESPLAPLDITLRSVLLPLLEGACKDVLMAGALGEEVNTRLELELSALDEEQQQHATPTLWRAADSVWRLAAGGLRGRLLAGRGNKGPATTTDADAGDDPDAAAEEEGGAGPQEQQEPQEPQPPPSQLAADAAPRVDDLLAWLRTEKAALACRHSSGLEELLASLPRTLRSSLRAQVYEGPGDFVRVFAHHEGSLAALSLPPSTAPCLPMPVASPPRAGRGGGGGASGGFGECHRLAPGVAQALKDIGRERFVLEGDAVGTPGEMQALLAELLARRCGVGGGGGKGGLAAARGGALPKGLEAAVQRCLCAASRTTFGGDVFFIVRDLFGGDGVVVAPLSVKRARGPVLSALDQHEDNNKGGANGGGGGGGAGGVAGGDTGGGRQQWGAGGGEDRGDLPDGLWALRGRAGGERQRWWGQWWCA